MSLRSILLAATLLSANCLAETPVTIKHVTLDQFMPNYLRVSIPLTLSVPASYELATFHKLEMFEAFYWMPKSEVAHADETGDLPGDSGYMHAEISLSAAYRVERDVFVGVEDMTGRDRKEFDSLFSDVRMERCSVGKFPVLLLDMKARKDGRHLRAMYVATLIDTNVVYIDYLAPRQHDEVGDYAWNDMKRSLTCRGPAGSATHGTPTAPAG
ncbi:MAG TPA: hypothetical protein VGH80_09160 [Xanthomonadaceae bacterium]|jgi:hypothetical protein